MAVKLNNNHGNGATRASRVHGRPKHRRRRPTSFEFRNGCQMPQNDSSGDEMLEIYEKDAQFAPQWRHLYRRRRRNHHATDTSMSDTTSSSLYHSEQINTAYTLNTNYTARESNNVKTTRIRPHEFSSNSVELTKSASTNIRLQSPVSSPAGVRRCYLCCDYNLPTVDKYPGMTLEEERRIRDEARTIRYKQVDEVLDYVGAEQDVFQIEVIPVTETFQEMGKLTYAELEGTGIVFVPTFTDPNDSIDSRGTLPWWLRDSFGESLTYKYTLENPSLHQEPSKFCCIGGFGNTAAPIHKANIISKSNVDKDNNKKSAWFWTQQSSLAASRSIMDDALQESCSQTASKDIGKRAHRSMQQYSTMLSDSRRDEETLLSWSRLDEDTFVSESARDFDSRESRSPITHNGRSLPEEPEKMGKSRDAIDSDIGTSYYGKSYASMEYHDMEPPLVPSLTPVPNSRFDDRRLSYLNSQTTIASADRRYSLSDERGSIQKSDYVIHDGVPMRRDDIVDCTLQEEYERMVSFNDTMENQDQISYQSRTASSCKDDSFSYRRRRKLHSDVGNSSLTFEAIPRTPIHLQGVPPYIEQEQGVFSSQYYDSKSVTDAASIQRYRSYVDHNGARSLSGLDDITSIEAIRIQNNSWDLDAKNLPKEGLLQSPIVVPESPPARLRIEKGSGYHNSSPLNSISSNRNEVNDNHYKEEYSSQISTPGLRGVDLKNSTETNDTSKAYFDTKSVRSPTRRVTRSPSQREENQLNSTPKIFNTVSPLQDIPRVIQSPSVSQGKLRSPLSLQTSSRGERIDSSQFVRHVENVSDVREKEEKLSEHSEPYGASGNERTGKLSVSPSRSPSRASTTPTRSGRVKHNEWFDHGNNENEMKNCTSPLDASKKVELSSPGQAADAGVNVISVLHSMSSRDATSPVLKREQNNYQTQLQSSSIKKSNQQSVLAPYCDDIPYNNDIGIFSPTFSVSRGSSPEEHMSEKLRQGNTNDVRTDGIRSQSPIKLYNSGDQDDEEKKKLDYRDVAVIDCDAFEERHDIVSSRAPYSDEKKNSVQMDKRQTVDNPLRGISNDNGMVLARDVGNVTRENLLGILSALNPQAAGLINATNDQDMISRKIISADNPGVVLFQPTINIYQNNSPVGGSIHSKGRSSRGTGKPKKQWDSIHPPATIEEHDETLSQCPLPSMSNVRNDRTFRSNQACDDIDDISGLENPSECSSWNGHFDLPRTVWTKGANPKFGESPTHKMNSVDSDSELQKLAMSEQLLRQELELIQKRSAERKLQVELFNHQHLEMGGCTKDGSKMDKIDNYVSNSNKKDEHCTSQLHIQSESQHIVDGEAAYFTERKAHYAPILDCPDSNDFADLISTEQSQEDIEIKTEVSYTNYREKEVPIVSQDYERNHSAIPAQKSRESPDLKDTYNPIPTHEQRVQSESSKFTENNLAFKNDFAKPGLESVEKSKQNENNEYRDSGSNTVETREMRAVVISESALSSVSFPFSASNRGTVSTADIAQSVASSHENSGVVEVISIDNESVSDESSMNSSSFVSYSKVNSKHVKEGNDPFRGRLLNVPPIHIQSILHSIHETKSLHDFETPDTIIEDNKQIDRRHSVRFDPGIKNSHATLPVYEADQASNLKGSSRASGEQDSYFFQSVDCDNASTPRVGNGISTRETPRVGNGINTRAKYPYRLEQQRFDFDVESRSRIVDEKPQYHDENLSLGASDWGTSPRSNPKFQLSQSVGRSGPTYSEDSSGNSRQNSVDEESKRSFDSSLEVEQTNSIPLHQAQQIRSTFLDPTFVDSNPIIQQHKHFMSRIANIRDNSFDSNHGGNADLIYDSRNDFDESKHDGGIHFEKPSLVPSIPLHSPLVKLSKESTADFLNGNQTTSFMFESSRTNVHVPSQNPDSKNRIFHFDASSDFNVRGSISQDRSSYSSEFLPASYESSKTSSLPDTSSTSSEQQTKDRFHIPNVGFLEGIGDSNSWDGCEAMDNKAVARQSGKKNEISMSSSSSHFGDLHLQPTTDMGNLSVSVNKPTSNPTPSHSMSKPLQKIVDKHRYSSSHVFQKSAHQAGEEGNSPGHLNTHKKSTSMYESDAVHPFRNQGYKDTTNAEYDSRNKSTKRTVSKARKEMLRRHSRTRTREGEDDVYKALNESTLESTDAKESAFRLRRGHSQFSLEQRSNSLLKGSHESHNIKQIDESTKESFEATSYRHPDLESTKESSTTYSPSQTHSSYVNTFADGSLETESQNLNGSISPKASSRMFRRLEQIRKLKPKRVSNAVEELLTQVRSRSDSISPRNRRNLSSAKIRTSKSASGKNRSPSAHEGQHEVRIAAKETTRAVVPHQAEQRSSNTQLTYRERVVKNLSRNKSKPKTTL